jgi:hypothetical protein
MPAAVEFGCDSFEEILQYAVGLLFKFFVAGFDIFQLWPVGIDI